MAQLDESLCYKLENLKFVSDDVNAFCFNLLNPSSRSVTLGFNQCLTEMSTSNLSGGGGGLG
jgi:hypothetical protein